ncbi:porin [Paraburkholderia sp. EG285A]|uniref:porin n=1 Tax=Paraburkholderia sp. EG285A TaxID=3237009 RepID=UPI0034D15C1E
MKKVCFAAAIALTPLLAHAQGSVTMYGIIDTYVEYAHGVTDSAGNSTNVFRTGNAGTYGSRWGLKGTEDLGGGYAAVFDLQQGFRLTNGTIPGGAGYAFARISTVGFSSPFGKLTFGRNYNLNAYTADLDPLYQAQYSSSSLLFYRNQTFTDNAVTFASAPFHGVTANFQYGFGNVAGNFQAGKTFGAQLRYDGSWLSAVAHYDEIRDPNGALSNLWAYSREYIVQARVNYQSAGFYVGYTGLSAPDASAGSPTHADEGWVGVGYQFTPALYASTGVYHIVAGDAGRATLVAARAEYSLSKRTTLYLAGSYVMNSTHAEFAFNGIDTPTAGTNQFGTMAGIRVSF